MSVGAKDHIEQMLVRKYANERMNNPEDAITKNIPHEKYWQYTKEIANMHRTLVNISNTMRSAKNPKTNPA